MNHLRDDAPEIIGEIVDVFKKHRVSPDEGFEIMVEMLRKLGETRRYLQNLKDVGRN